MAEEFSVNQELEDLFLRKKPARLLVHLKKTETPYASTLAKKIDCTYAHTVKLLQKMEELDLVSSKKDGRVKYVELTDLGKDLADELDILLYRRMTRKTGETKVETTEELIEETHEEVENSED